MHTVLLLCVLHEGVELTNIATEEIGKTFMVVIEKKFLFVFLTITPPY